MYSQQRTGKPLHKILKNIIKVRISSQSKLSIVSISLCSAIEDTFSFSYVNI